MGCKMMALWVLFDAVQLSVGSWMARSLVSLPDSALLLRCVVCVVAQHRRGLYCCRLASTTKCSAGPHAVVAVIQCNIARVTEWASAVCLCSHGGAAGAAGPARAGAADAATKQPHLPTSHNCSRVTGCANLYFIRSYTCQAARTPTITARDLGFNMRGAQDIGT